MRHNLRIFPRKRTFMPPVSINTSILSSLIYPWRLILFVSFVSLLSFLHLLYVFLLIYFHSFCVIPFVFQFLAGGGGSETAYMVLKKGLRMTRMFLTLVAPVLLKFFFSFSFHFISSIKFNLLSNSGDVSLIIPSRILY